MATKACCSSAVACGYDVGELNEMDFPGIGEFIKGLTSGDPNDRCVPESFFFGTSPPLPKRRVEVEGGEDVLLTPDCMSYHVLAFGLPGCCLPNSTCGLSTDESWPVFAGITQGAGGLFTKPECLSAEALNQQLRDTVVLADFARTMAGGTCNHPALDAELASGSAGAGGRAAAGSGGGSGTGAGAGGVSGASAGAGGRSGAGGQAGR